VKGRNVCLSIIESYDAGCHQEERLIKMRFLMLQLSENVLKRREFGCDFLDSESQLARKVLFDGKRDHIDLIYLAVPVDNQEPVLNERESSDIMWLPTQTIVRSDFNTFDDVKEWVTLLSGEMAQINSLKTCYEPPKICLSGVVRRMKTEALEKQFFFFFQFTLLLSFLLF
jgi:hypothetical protein